MTIHNTQHSIVTKGQLLSLPAKIDSNFAKKHRILSMLSTKNNTFCGTIAGNQHQLVFDIKNTSQFSINGQSITLDVPHDATQVRYIINYKIATNNDLELKVKRDIQNFTGCQRVKFKPIHITKDNTSTELIPDQQKQKPALSHLTSNTQTADALGYLQYKSQKKSEQQEGESIFHHKGIIITHSEPQQEFSLPAIEHTQKLHQEGTIEKHEITLSIRVLSSPIGEFTLTQDLQKAIEIIKRNTFTGLGAGFNALHGVAITGDQELLERALDSIGGSNNIDASTEKNTLLDKVLRFNGVPAANQDSALMIAIFLHRSHIAKKFIELGADCTYVNGTGNTPLHLAAGTGSQELVELICQKLSNHNTLSEYINKQTVPGGKTPLHHAAQLHTKNPDAAQLLIQTLLQHGASSSLDTPDAQKNTPRALFNQHNIPYEDSEYS